MDGQQEIPQPQGPDPLGPCAWCQGEAIGTVQVREPKYGTVKGAKVMTKGPISVPVCKKHSTIHRRSHITDLQLKNLKTTVAKGVEQLSMFDVSTATPDNSAFHDA